MDDLHAVWQRYDERLSRVETLAAQTFASNIAERAERAARRARINLAVEILAGAILVAALGSFTVDHAGSRALFAAGLASWLYSIGILIGGFVPLALAAGVRFDEPVAVAQRRLEQAMHVRVVATTWAVVLGPFMWLPFAAVAVEAILGIDLFRFDPAWIVGNVAFGIVAGLLGLLTLAILGRYGKLNAMAQRILGDTIGRSLRDSAAFLQTLGEE